MWGSWGAWGLGVVTGAAVAVVIAMNVTSSCPTVDEATPASAPAVVEVQEVVDLLPTVSPQSLTVVMCCDSITFEPQWFHYKHRLKGLLKGEAVYATFINVAISGTSCDYWTTRLPALLVQHDADVLLLNCGTNDDATTPAMMSRFRDNYTKLITDAQAARPSEPIKVIASKIQISDRNNPNTPGWLPDNEVRVNTIIEEVTDGWPLLGVADMSVFPTDAANTPDGVHPGPEGHTFYANAWFAEGKLRGWW